MRAAALIAACLLAAPALADDAPTGGAVEFAGLKAKLPAGWKSEAPSNSMRLAQYKLPKAEGDAEDAELALFAFPGGAGTPKQNLERQTAKFLETNRTETSGSVKVGPYLATLQDVAGSYKKKSSPTATDYKVANNYRQLYVLFIVPPEGKQYYMTLLGPKATVEKHKKAFDDLLAEFK